MATIYAGLFQDGPRAASGAALPNASFKLYNPNTTTQPTYYTNRLKGGTVVTDPSNDAAGNCTLYAEPGTYELWYGGSFIKMVTVPQDNDEDDSAITAAVTAFNSTHYTKTQVDSLLENFSPALTNAPANWGQHTRAKLAANGLVRVAAVGDSTTRGYYSSNLDSTSWVGLLKSRLQVEHGNGGSGFKGAGDTLTFMTAASIGAEAKSAYLAANNLLVQTGTWTGYGSVAFGPGNYAVRTQQANATITYVGSGTTIRIFTIGGNSAWQYKVDGGAYTSGTIGGGGLQVQTITGLSAGSHTIVVKYNGNGTSDTLYVVGFDARNTTGVVVDNYANYGSQAASVDNYIGGNDWIGNGLWSGGNKNPADLVIWNFGLNDAASGTVTPDEFGTSLRRYFDGVLNGNGAVGATDLLIVMSHPGNYDEDKLFHGYYGEVVDIAFAFNAAVVNMWGALRNSYDYADDLNYWGNATSPGDPGSDSVHLSNAGNSLVYEQVNSIIELAA